MKIPVSAFALWLLAIPIATGVIFTVVPMLFSLPDEPEGHALSHGLPAIAIALVALGIWRTDAAIRRGERLALSALAVLAAGQLLEALAAYAEYPTMGVLHDGLSVVSGLAFIAVVAGVLWAAGEAAMRREVPVWVAIAVLAAVVALMVRLMIGF